MNNGFDLELLVHVYSPYDNTIIKLLPDATFENQHRRVRETRTGYRFCFLGLRDHSSLGGKVFGFEGKTSESFDSSF